MPPGEARVGRAAAALAAVSPIWVIYTGGVSRYTGGTMPPMLEDTQDRIWMAPPQQWEPAIPPRVSLLMTGGAWSLAAAVLAWQAEASSACNSRRPPRLFDRVRAELRLRGLSRGRAVGLLGTRTYRNPDTWQCRGHHLHQTVAQ